MNIKLISPRMSLRPMDSEFKRRLSPSISLATIASMIGKHHHVTIADENVEKLDITDSPDLVGITVNVDTAKRTYKISSQYRNRGIKVILGGIHASANPEEALQNADSVCIGEAEEIIGDVIRDLQKGFLRKKYYCRFPTNPAKIPIPNMSLIDKTKYLYTNIICSSRGCPYKCGFCYNSIGFVHKKYRNRPIENVIKEILQFCTKQVMFIDDNFIGNPKHAMKLAKKNGTS